MTEASRLKRNMFVCLFLGIIIGALGTYAVDHSWLQTSPRNVVPSETETLVPFPTCPETMVYVDMIGTFVIAPFAYSDWTPYWIQDPAANVRTLIVAKDFHRPITGYHGWFGIFVTVNASVSVDVYDYTNRLGSIHGAGGYPSDWTEQGGYEAVSSNVPSFKFGNPNPFPISICYHIYSRGTASYVPENMTVGCVVGP